jgi:hypothetical protein
MRWGGWRLGVAVLLAGCVDGGTKLGALPPVNLDLYLSMDGGAGYAMVNLVATDPARCVTLSYRTAATVNGVLLGLTEDGGTSSTQSGTPYCIVDQYDGSGIPVGGDGTLVLTDDTATFRIVATGGLDPGTITFIAPADGTMHFGQPVQIGIPSRGRMVTYALVSFALDGASTSSFFAELGSGLTASADVLSFGVPTNPPNVTVATGTGTFQVNVQFADEVTTCDGPVSCTAFSSTMVTLPATLANN